MYPKKEIKSLYKEIVQHAIDSYELQLFDISFKIRKKRATLKNEPEDERLHKVYGYSSCDLDKHKIEIVLHWDHIEDKEQAISTIIHEFMHMGFAEAFKRLNKKSKPTDFANMEEDFVYRTDVLITRVLQLRSAGKI